jgi:hypothetical protein
MQPAIGYIERCTVTNTLKRIYQTHYDKGRFRAEEKSHLSFNCICVFGDISGFTKLADLYNEHGAGVTLTGGDLPSSGQFINAKLAADCHLVLAATDATFRIIHKLYFRLCAGNNIKTSMASPCSWVSTRRIREQSECGQR